MIMGSPKFAEQIWGNKGDEDKSSSSRFANARVYEIIRTNLSNFS